MHIRLSIVALGLMVITQCIFAQECPKTLSPGQLSKLKERPSEILEINNASFVLDGSSRKVLKTIDIKEGVNLNYTGKHDGNKPTCWYNTAQGYVGIRQVSHR